MRRVCSLFALAGACFAFAMSANVATAPRRAPLSRDLQLHQKARPRHATRVIVHGDPDALRVAASRHRVRLLRVLDHDAVVEADAAQIEALASDPVVEHLSGDVPVQSAMAISNKSTAADQVHAGASALLDLVGSIPGVNGHGIGIALVDSGVSAHRALGSSVVASVSLVTGDPDSSDEFGHGTHIAGIITGSPAAAEDVTESYAGGVAPGAHIVSVRVLRDDGTGLTSDVIAGIDWVIANRSKHNIRVINLSLGHAVMEPVATDPLCEAVERAVRAGIVVVASAGNRGKTDRGGPILGGITSPGNSPYAITVGALNTFETLSRADDSVATYSSRGPTRYDLAVKPDVVAPGNNIVSLEVPSSHLAKTYPATHVAGKDTNAYMRLSGTSMATAVVSGGVALLLQGKPALDPQQVKLLVQAGSQYLVRDGLIAAGAGSVNLWSSRRASVNGLDDLPMSVPLVGGLLSPPSGVAFRDTGTMTQRMYEGNGSRLLGVPDLAGALLNPSRLPGDTLHLVGESNPVAQMGAKYITWGDVAYWTNSNYITWGDLVRSPDGNYITWGDTRMSDRYDITWGDAIGEGDPQ